MNKLGSRITSVAVVSMSILILSLLLPRILNFGDGFSSATSAALIFLMLFLLSTVLALYTLIKTCWNFSGLNLQVRVLGVMPFLLLIAAGLVIYSKL